MFETIGDIISSVGEYISEVLTFIKGVGEMFIMFCDFIPMPFKGILLSVLAIVIIILILRSVGK